MKEPMNKRITYDFVTFDVDGSIVAHETYWGTTKNVPGPVFEKLLLIPRLTATPSKDNTIDCYIDGEPDPKIRIDAGETLIVEKHIEDDTTVINVYCVDDDNEGKEVYING